VTDVTSANASEHFPPPFGWCWRAATVPEEAVVALRLASTFKAYAFTRVLLTR
jgi:hypothetical protein